MQVVGADVSLQFSDVQWSNTFLLSHLVLIMEIKDSLRSISVRSDRASELVKIELLGSLSVMHSSIVPRRSRSFRSPSFELSFFGINHFHSTPITVPFGLILLPHAPYRLG